MRSSPPILSVRLAGAGLPIKLMIVPVSVADAAGDAESGTASASDGNIAAMVCRLPVSVIVG
jgi:hypothetical protein